MVRSYFVLLYAFVCSYNLNAQCCAIYNDQILSVNSINTYYPPLPNDTAIAGDLTIALGAVPPNDPFGNSYGTVPISAGDIVMIIQMQGASINASNDASFGSGLTNSGPDGLGGTGITSLNNVGQYELAIAMNDVPLSGGILQLNGACSNGGLANTYFNLDASNTQGQLTYQVVRIPRFPDLTLQQDVSVTAWNGAVGGVLAFFISDTLNFNGYSISATGKGFRGGYQNVRPSGTNVTTYVTTDISLSSGKGEGVAGTPRFLWNGQSQVDNGVNWIGYPGGNYGRGAAGNAGGGGNTHNAGGGGGSGHGSGGVGGNAINGMGVAAFPNGGRPGAGIAIPQDRLIMGGGGGGGDANNAQTGVKGGAGGGIVFIKAGYVVGTGNITSSGTDGQVGVYGNAPDGAGGGGGGGNIFILCENDASGSTLTIEAKGGKGGNTLNDASDPHGPGGGGGGGTIYYQLPGSVPSTNVIQGNSGASNNGNNTPHGAVAGQPGIVNTIDSTILSPNLSISLHPFPIADFSDTSVCENQNIQFQDQSIIQNSFTSIINNWIWDFGDGDTSTAQNPIHAYDSAGQYQVSLIISTNFGCADTIIKTITIHPHLTTLTNQQACVNYTWPENNIQYTQSGLYEVYYTTVFGCDSTVQMNLTVNDAFTSDTFAIVCDGYSFNIAGTDYLAGTHTINLQSIYGCDSVIMLTLNEYPVLSSSIIDTICDGTSFTLGNQVFTDNGVYDVTFQNIWGCDSIVTLYLTINAVTQDSIIYPNVFSPNQDQLNDDYYITGATQEITEFEIIIYNRWGYQVYKTNDKDFIWNGQQSDVSLVSGVYFYVSSFSLKCKGDKIFKKHGTITIF